MQEFWRRLTLLGSMGFVAAIYFSVRFSIDTRNEMFFEFYEIVPMKIAVPGEATSGL